MKKRDRKRTFVIKRSGWSAFSLLLYLILGLGAPIFFYLKQAGKLPIELPEALASFNLPVIAIVAWIAVAFIWVCVLVHNAKQTRYYWKGNVIVTENGKVFSGMVENKRFIFTPGMAVYVQQSVKGWFFRYGTVCITMGSATAGEFRMEHVKRPYKVKRFLAEYLIEYSYSSAYTSSPYIVNPYAYLNMFPGYFGGFGMGYPYGMMAQQGAQGGQPASFPYSAAYNTMGAASPYNF